MNCYGDFAGKDRVFQAAFGMHGGSSFKWRQLECNGRGTPPQPSHSLREREGRNACLSLPEGCEAKTCQLLRDRA